MSIEAQNYYLMYKTYHELDDMIPNCEDLNTSMTFRKLSLRAMDVMILMEPTLTIEDKIWFNEEIGVDYFVIPTIHSHFHDLKL